MILGVDQSSAQLLILNSQLSYLKGRYWQLTGLEAVTDKKTPRLHHNNGESSQCFPRKQVTTNSPPVQCSIIYFSYFYRLPLLKHTRLGARLCRTFSSGTETGTISTSPCLRSPGCFLTNNLSMLPWWTNFPGPDLALICSYFTGLTFSHFHNNNNNNNNNNNDSVWNYEEVHKILPDAVFITLLRDPVQCFESNYVYMGLQNIFQ